jgi:hypothetical protein
MPELTTQHDPIHALETYLAERDDLATIRTDLIAAARVLAQDC